MPSTPADPHDPLDPRGPADPRSRPAPRDRPRLRPMRSARELTVVLREPRVASVAVTSLVARLPKGTVSLALILLVRSESGSLAVAGLVAAAFAFGDAVSAPLLGRALDRLGRRRILMLCLVVHVVAVLAATATADRAPIVAGLAAVAGFALPPIGGAAKTVWPLLVERDRVHAVYTLESAVQQVVFFAGPLLVSAVISVSASTAAGLVVGAALIAVGTVAFVVVIRGLPEPTARSPLTVHGTERGPARRRTALNDPVVRVMAGATMAQGVALGAFGVCVVALAADAGSPSSAGVVQAMLTVGGLLGTLAAGHPLGLRRFSVASAAFAAIGGCVALLAASGVPIVVVAVVVVLQGTLLTPLAAATYRFIADATSSRTRAEAFGWLSTALAAGNAAGSTAAGWIAELHGAGPALAVGPAAVMISAAVVGLHSRRRP